MRPGWSPGTNKVNAAYPLTSSTTPCAGMANDFFTLVDGAMLESNNAALGGIDALSSTTSVSARKVSP